MPPIVSLSRSEVSECDWRDLVSGMRSALRAAPFVTFYGSDAQNILALSMIPPSRSETQERPPRLNLLPSTMAVLRFPNGQQVRGRLQVISATGGLLCLSSPLNQDSPVKLMFRAENGLVFG